MYNLFFCNPFIGEMLEFDIDKYISKSKRILKFKKGILSFCLENNYSLGLTEVVRAINK